MRQLLYFSLLTLFSLFQFSGNLIVAQTGRPPIIIMSNQGGDSGGKLCYVHDRDFIYVPIEMIVGEGNIITSISLEFTESNVTLQPYTIFHFDGNVANFPLDVDHYIDNLGMGNNPHIFGTGPVFTFLENELIFKIPYSEDWSEGSVEFPDINFNIHLTHNSQGALVETTLVENYCDNGFRSDEEDGGKKRLMGNTSPVDILVAPNPTKDMSTLTLNLEKSVTKSTISIISMDGREVQLIEGPMDAGTQVVEIPARKAPGIYYIKVILDGEVHIKEYVVLPSK